MKTKTKLSKAAALRVAIAKDVLQRMRYRGVVCGIYYTSAPNIGQITNPQKQIRELEKGCQVCALGAMFLSYIKICDRVPASDFFTTESDYSGATILNASDTDMRSRMECLFDYEQLGLIEGAFENFRDRETYNLYPGLPPSERLRKIMRNVIRNDGVYVPTQDKPMVASSGADVCVGKAV